VAKASGTLHHTEKFYSAVISVRSIINHNFFDQGQSVALHSHNFFPKIGVPLPGEIIQIISN
jgi:hypothetical protein